jgi:diketogulonate reductase-like aldo/keto reductase
MKSFAVLSSTILGLASAQDWKFDPIVTPSSVEELPTVGFGTWSLPKDNKGVEAVASALKLGYRSFDGATAYQNQKWVGEGFKLAMQRDPTLKRSDFFVTTK